MEARLPIHICARKLLVTWISTFRANPDSPMSIAWISDLIWAAKCDSCITNLRRGDRVVELPTISAANTKEINRGLRN